MPISDTTLGRLVEAIPVGVVVVDADGEIINFNRYAQELFQNKLHGNVFNEFTGYSQFRIDGTPYPIDELPLACSLKTGWETRDTEILIRHEDGIEFTVVASSNALRDDSGNITGAIAVLQDITNRKLMEEMLIDNERRFRKVFEEGPLGVAIISLDSRIVRVNQKFCQMLGYSEKRLTDMNFPDITHPEDTEKDQMLSQSLLKGEIPLYTIEKRYLKSNKQVIWINLTSTLSRSEIGVPLYFIAMMEDITERKRLESELFKAATTDKLTGIYNRQVLDGRMAEELERSRRYQQPFSLVMMDIDKFKLINDNHGHLTGDHVLQAVSETMKRSIRGVDLLGRWGGEEFMIVAPGTTAPNAVILAEKLRQALEKLEVDNLKNITASFGVTEYQAEDSLDAMIKRVDSFLYKAKQGGRNRVESG